MVSVERDACRDARQDKANPVVLVVEGCEVVATFIGIDQPEIGLHSEYCRHSSCDRQNKPIQENDLQQSLDGSPLPRPRMQRDPVGHEPGKQTEIPAGA
jgi:hypothetical protein